MFFFWPAWSQNPKRLKLAMPNNFKEIWLDFYSKNMKKPTIKHTRVHLLTVNFFRIQSSILAALERLDQHW
jgi:hypothetical protein